MFPIWMNLVREKEFGSFVDPYIASLLTGASSCVVFRICYNANAIYDLKLVQKSSLTENLFHCVKAVVVDLVSFFTSEKLLTASSLPPCWPNDEGVEKTKIC